MLTADQKIWRRAGIGGSDARTVAFGGAQEWAALRNEKVEGIEPTFGDEQRLLMDMGHAIEPVCLDYFTAKVTALKQRDVPFTSALDPYFRCTLDGLTEAMDPVQCKFHTGDKRLGELIEYYWPQLQHELFVTGAPKLHMAVIFGHYGRFEHEEVAPDQAFLDTYIARAFQFKAYVETGVLPDGMRLFPKANIPRVREHVWPVNDNEVADAAVTWLGNAGAAKRYEDAAKVIKAAVPDDAKAAKWLRDGVGIRVTVDKRGAKKIASHVETA